VPVTGNVAAFGETQRPGHYLVRTGDGRELSEEHFAVNVDGAESDLRPLDLDEAELVLVGGSSEVARTVTAETMSSSKDGWTPQSWVTLLLFLVAATFLVESLLTVPRVGRS